MKQFSFGHIIFFLLLTSVGFAQIPLPYIQSFDSYTTNQTLNGDGGIVSTSHVYVTPYGIVGNCAEFQMTDTALSGYDTLTSPQIGPLTANTTASFYFRAVTFGGGVPSVYHMTASDKAVIYIGVNLTFAAQLTIDSSNQNTDSSYVKVTIGAPAWVSGFSGKFRIVAFNPSANNWRLEFDSLVVRDTVSTRVPPVLSTSVTNVKCRGQSTGAIKVTASGGAPYTYLWSPGGQTTDSIIDQPAGTYTVTVTDSLGGVASMSVVINQPAFALLLDSLSKTSVACYGASTGTATIYASGGTTPYRYHWSNIQASATDSAVDLAAGNYSVTVTDANGCSLTATTHVTQPSVPQTISTSTTQSSSGSNGTASVIATGGAGSFTYLWSTTPAQTSASISGLAPGLYEVTVTDGGGCVIVDTAFVAFPNGINELNGQSILIYPNPATDHIYVEMATANPPWMTVSINDLSGRIIIQEVTSNSINTSSLANGIYLIKVSTDEEIYKSRLIIQR
jgi:hypothetical protein